MYYIGVDLGGTGIKIGVVDEKGTIIEKDSCPTRVKDGYKEIVKDMSQVINSLKAKLNISDDEIHSIGIGSPGAIDDKNGVVIFSGNLEFDYVPLAEEMKKYFDKPVYVGNDANCAALGEYFALNDDSIEDFVAVTLGTGVGGGIIMNKKIFTGFNGMAGEIGHMGLVMNGEPCTCGKRGCWEAYASATAIIRETEKAAREYPDSYVAKLVEENGGKGSGKTAFIAQRAGDKIGDMVVKNYVQAVAEGIINIINAIQPQVVVIGGGVSKEGEGLINPVREYVEEYSFGPSTVKKAELRLATLGNDAGIIGAAFLGK